ncbi:alpha/beta fold hydrolase [Nocardia aurea]|uniref:alpha/beta fold hydrolase n=1 Tax=Nocardia aurea TaxID=2144174 RepID=UPI000D694232|nr:alpha/beta hydrolase [Nocardia aurea]
MSLEPLTHTVMDLTMASRRRRGPGPAGRTHDTWSLDLPGFGHSGKPDDLPIMVGLADAVAAWLDAAGLARPCPAYWAGPAAARWPVDGAARFTGRTGALVLVGPTVDPHARLVGQWLRNAVRESPRMTPLNVADYRDAGPRRVPASFGASLRDRIEDKLLYVDLPVLVVRGGKDRMVSQVWAEEVTRLLPHGRLSVMDGLPHMVPYRDPHGLAREVATFLREVGS